MKHTVDHAIKPGLCHCKSYEINNCVICRKDKMFWTAYANKNYTDTCCFSCNAKLLTLQRLQAEESTNESMPQM